MKQPGCYIGCHNWKIPILKLNVELTWKTRLKMHRMFSPEITNDSSFAEDFMKFSFDQTEKIV